MTGLLQSVIVQLNSILLDFRRVRQLFNYCSRSKRNIMCSFTKLIGSNIINIFKEHSKISRNMFFFLLKNTFILLYLTLYLPSSFQQFLKILQTISNFSKFYIIIPYFLLVSLTYRLGYGMRLYLKAFSTSRSFIL